jgi:hypothetical protein
MDTLIVTIIVIVAAAYLVITFRKKSKSKEGLKCGAGCGKCISRCAQPPKPQKTGTGGQKQSKN